MVERRATRVTLVSSHRFLTVNYDQYYTFLPLFAQPLPKPPPCTNDAKTLAFFLKTPIKAKGRTCNSPPLSPRPRLSPPVACFITFFFFGFWFFFSFHHHGDSTPKSPPSPSPSPSPPPPFKKLLPPRRYHHHRDHGADLRLFFIDC